MPIYEYRDNSTLKMVDVMRAFAEYDVPPTNEEALEAGLTQEEFETADWERILGSGIKMVKSDSWGAGKGHW